MPQVTLELFIARWSASAAAERDQYVFEKGALLLKDGQATLWSAVRIA